MSRSRSRTRRSLAASLTAVAAVVAVQGVTPSALAATTDASGTTTRDGLWTVLDDRSGTTVVWDGSRSLPHGDARPVFAQGGVPLGTPTGGVHGAPLRLVAPGVHGLRAGALSVLVNGRPLGATTTRRAATTAAATALPPRPTTLLTPDPGATGPYRTTAFAYHLADLTITGLPVPVEVQGQVVAPVGAPGKRPVVLILHGRHSTCYLGSDSTIDWPCSPGYQPIPSFEGYRATQALLASRGYVTVSIAANGINGQDGDLIDAGAHARSVLVRHHLSLLAGWNGTTAGPAGTAALRGHLDLQRVMLVGHSRGGEGVDRAAIEATDADPFRIVGQVLIAPTDFGRQVAVGIPTTVLLPYCDGDVSDLQGQQYVDQSRGLASGDHALVTAAMVFGADHNFFNSEWTPGVAKAPAQDDWSDDADPVCGASAPDRLSAKAQRAVGATYVSAAADSYLASSTSAVRLIDGSKVRAASAGGAVVLTEALGGARTPLIGDGAAAALTSSGGMVAGTCLGFSDDTSAQCVADGLGTPPHWLRGDIPATSALRAQWSSAGATASVRLAAPVDLSHSTYVDLRVVADPSTPSSSTALVLTDTSGRSAAVGAGSIAPLPGPAGTRKLWALSLRVPLGSFAHVDLGHVRSVGLRGTSRSGHVVVLDAFGARTGQVPSTVTPRSVPRFDVTSPSVVLPPDDATHQVPVTIKVVGTVRVPAQLWVAAQGNLPSPSPVQSVTVAPGSRSVVVTVPVVSSSVYSTYPDRLSVAVYARHDAVVGDYIGGGDVVSSVPPPTLRALQAHVVVRQGGTIRWTLRLSAPTRYGWYGQANAVAPTTGTELTTAGVLRAWVQDHTTSPTLPDGRAAPLSAAGASTYVAFEPLSTTYTLELPTATTSSARTDRTVELDIAPDGIIVTQPLRLTAVVHP